MPADGPLSTVSEDALGLLFESDPLVLTDAQLDVLVLELRRRRSDFASSEAAKAAAGKKSRTKPEPQSASALATLTKPTGEIELDDLL